MQTSHSMLYTFIIIDDDQISIDILKAYLSRMKEFTMLATFTDPIAGVKAIREYGEIDFLFLDIAMEISGIDIAPVIREQVRHIVFITAYQKYALDAFRAYGDKFLVKPINQQKMQAAIADLIRKDKRKGV